MSTKLAIPPLTIRQSDDWAAMTSVMMEPEIRSGLQLPDGFSAAALWREGSIFLLIEEGDFAAGFLWGEIEPEGLMCHIFLRPKYRGATALKVIRAAINWVFVNTEYEHVMAHPPFRHSYLLCKMLGFYDVREEEYNDRVLGHGVRKVIRLDKSRWFKSLLHTPFIVTGYPRSGTAWYSNFLTCSGALCWHEGSAYGAAAGLWLYGAENRGISDSMVTMKTRLIEENPDSPVVLIKRDKGEAKASLLKWFGSEINNIDRLFGELERKFEWLESRSGTMVVPFAEAFEMDTLERVWKYCLPKLPFDKTRAEFLRALNVQQNLNYILSNGVPNPIDYGQALALPESPAKSLL